MTPVWLTVSEVCERLRITRDTYDKWRMKRVAPPAKRLPNGRLLTRSDRLEEWLVNAGLRGDLRIRGET